MTLAHLVKKAPIDLIDDLEMARQDPLEQIDRPLFERLRAQGMVGIRQRPNGQIPGLVPAEIGSPAAARVRARVGN